MKVRLGEDTGERHIELDSFAISKAKHCPVRRRRRKRFSFIFFSDSWSINGDRNNIRNYWIC